MVDRGLRLLVEVWRLLDLASVAGRLVSEVEEKRTVEGAGWRAEWVWCPMNVGMVALHLIGWAGPSEFTISCPSFDFYSWPEKPGWREDEWRLLLETLVTAFEWTEERGGAWFADSVRQAVDLALSERWGSAALWLSATGVGERTAVRLTELKAPPGRGYWFIEVVEGEDGELRVLAEGWPPPGAPMLIPRLIAPWLHHLLLTIPLAERLRGDT